MTEWRNRGEVLKFESSKVLKWKCASGLRFFNTEDTEIDTEDTKGITSFFTARVAKDYATYAMVYFCALCENSASSAVKVI